MYSFLKRSLDLILAWILLIAAAPLFGWIALAVFVESGGPVFFVQQRVGLRGVVFPMYKFRSLRAGSNDLTDPLSRVTRVGKFLRRWGLDELPQLWNVIKGDMSIIGPRPTVPEQVARYGEYEKQRLSVRPGITGWAQIHGRNAIDWGARIDLDVEYIRRANLGLDLAILARTPLSLLSSSNVYGPDGRNPDFSQANPHAHPPVLPVLPQSRLLRHRTPLSTRQNARPAA